MRPPKHTWPAGAVAAMDAIRTYQRSAGRGATRSYVKATAVGHPVDASRGLDWLKKQRLVSWANDGAGTRYEESKR